VLTCLDFSILILGLGICLPFYINMTAAIGGIIRLIFNVARR
jgi:hypothetical protein